MQRGDDTMKEHIEFIEKCCHLFEMEGEVKSLDQCPAWKNALVAAALL
jgi:hypothetical protein